MCDELCPGVIIRECPQSCHAFDHVALGICSQVGAECGNDAGERCVCDEMTNKPKCGPFPELASGCPLTCSGAPMPRAPGATDAGPHAPIDAAADDDAGR
jgi:hypothetical protein